jgi:hypothetical protein
MTVTIEPDLLEIVFGAFAQFEAIHGNKHRFQLLLLARHHSGESPDLQGKWRISPAVISDN